MYLVMAMQQRDKLIEEIRRIKGLMAYAGLIRNGSSLMN